MGCSLRAQQLGPLDFQAHTTASLVRKPPQQDLSVLVTTSWPIQNTSIDNNESLPERTPAKSGRDSHVLKGVDTNIRTQRL